MGENTNSKNNEEYCLVTSSFMVKFGKSSAGKEETQYSQNQSVGNHQCCVLQGPSTLLFAHSSKAPTLGHIRQGGKFMHAAWDNLNIFESLIN